MNLPFLRNLPGLGGRPINRIILTAAASATGAEAALQHLLTEQPELLMAAVVATSSGQALASYTTEARFWPGAVAPFWSAMVQQLKSAQVVQGQGEEKVEEVLTTLASQLHLLRLQPGEQHFLYLAIDSRDSNLALAREVMRQAIDLL
jgi:ribosomal protein S18 acetylase RimI-like enzyme